MQITKVISPILGLTNQRVEDRVDQDTLSFRLKMAMKFANLTQSELARKIGIKPQVIQYLCQKNIKSSRFTYLIADALNVNHDWLAAGVGPMASTDPTFDGQYKIPALTSNNLRAYIEQGTLDINVRYIFSDNNHASFAITLDDNSMEPRFEKNTVLVFEIKKKYKNNDFVIANINRHGTCIFRQLKTCGPKQNLVPINSDLYKEIPLQKEDVIYGRLIQTIFTYNRE